MHGSLEAAEEAARDQVPIGRLGTVEEIAAAGAFLCSARAELHHRRGAAGGRRLDAEHLMLGLPDGIRACLFDLDGVLTQTAKVHAAAWKQMFDEYLRSRPEPFREFTQDDYDDLRGRQAAPGRRALVPRLARDRAARGVARRPGRP